MKLPIINSVRMNTQNIVKKTKHAKSIDIEPVKKYVQYIKEYKLK